MELIELKNRIYEAFTGSEDELNAIIQLVNEDEAIFPFNEYEHLICNAIESGGLTYEQCIEIRLESIGNNPNLWIFEIAAPRGFGEKFAQTYVHGKCSKLAKPSKKTDKSYNGEYDFLLDNIKIEVKASRAVDADSDEQLMLRLSRDRRRSRF